MKHHDLVIQLGSQVQFIDGQYKLAPHTRMRTAASAIVLKKGIAPRLMIAGGSNFGVRYDDEKVFNDQHPFQKKPDFTFEAFAYSDFQRKSEAAVIKDVLVHEFNIDPAKVLAETLSSTTEENAEFLKIILRRRPMFTGNENIAILTLLVHMEKALPAFHKAGLNVKPLFAENLLTFYSNYYIPQAATPWVEEICRYYSIPKDGKQYNVDRIRQLLLEGKSLEEMMWPYWYVTVIDGHICADGEPEELEKTSTRWTQARNQKEASLALRVEEDFVKGPFENIEKARNDVRGQ